MARSREYARELVSEGRVLVGGSVADKPARLVSAAEALVVTGGGPRYVSRGGLKLLAALERFGLQTARLRCLDLGASTGGFTDCLLQAGCSHVVAVDVGYGQLHPKLRADPRVTVLERTNCRFLAAEDIGGRCDLVVADLSFISLQVVTDHVWAELIGDHGQAIWLVKPQFEAGRAEVSKGRGVVRDPATWSRAIENVAIANVRAGAAIEGIAVSPVLGPAGNVEFLMYCSSGGQATGDSSGGAVVGGMIEAAVAEGLALRTGSAEIPGLKTRHAEVLHDGSANEV